MRPKPEDLDYRTALFKAAADRLGFKTKVILSPYLIEISWKTKSTKIYRTSTQVNDAVANRISRNKHDTNLLLKKNKLPSPEQFLIQNLSDLDKIITNLGFPLVAKPVNGEAGFGVTADINSRSHLISAVKKIWQFGQTCIVEKHIHGSDFRLVVLDGHIIGAVSRTAPHITGNGKNTIKELINSQTKLTYTKALKLGLKNRLTDPKTILKNNHVLTILSNANYTTGAIATTIDVDTIHPSIQNLAVKATKTIGLNLAGIDIIATNITKPVTNNAYIIEVNSQPGIYMHHFPDHGDPQDLATPILQNLLAE